MLYEDDVVAAVVAHLRADGWEVEGMALATEHSDDIAATRNGERLVVEAKRDGRSKSHTSGHGSRSTRGRHPHTSPSPHFGRYEWHPRTPPAARSHYLKWNPIGTWSASLLPHCLEPAFVPIGLLQMAA